MLEREIGTDAAAGPASAGAAGGEKTLVAPSEDPR
jgi:hypothetical protein